MNKYIAISQQDLKYNADRLMECIDATLIGVVKCNGYGLGIDLAVRTWYESGVRFFAVSEPGEALAIRKLGYEDAEVLLLAPTWDAETVRALHEANVIMTVTDAGCARFLASVCKEARVHVKVNVGMGRFGLKYTRVQEIALIYQQEGLQFEGIFAHFPQSFAEDSTVTMKQLEHFNLLTEQLRAQGIDVGLRHIANSCGALKYPEARLDAVRIGSALTGRLPGKVPCELKRIGILKAQIADLTVLEAGDTSGYSMVCKIKEKTNAAVVAAGYMDGWGVRRQIPALCRMDVLRNMYHAFREGVTRQTVTWQGKKLNVLGRIGTQYTVIDRGDSELKPGDWVEIEMNMMMADSSLPRILED